jgi:hypothetical protein
MQRHAPACSTVPALTASMVGTRILLGINTAVVRSQ